MIKSKSNYKLLVVTFWVSKNCHTMPELVKLCTTLENNYNLNRLSDQGLSNMNDGREKAPTSQFEVELDVLISKQVI